MYMTTTGRNGRLGNQVIRNLAVSLIAEKYDLCVNYYNEQRINNLGIKLFSGSKSFSNTIPLTDDNFFSIYNSGNLNDNLNPNDNYFQTLPIINLLHTYLHSDKIKANIIESNPFNARYNANNDLYIHIRLTDATQWNPGINYYMNAIKTINFDNMYISTDDRSHNIINEIMKAYPSAALIECDEIATFQYASTCKNIILSHGSFSAVIGYLSFFSTVNYPEYDLNNMWHGDMFSINGWIKHSYK
jgi:hypothetical protein